MPSLVARRAALRHRVVVVALATVLLGCQGESGDRNDFAAAWEATRGLVPGQDVVEADPDACSDALGALRTARTELPPAPDTVITDAVDDWFSIAEATLFDCPPSGGELDGFDEAYAELAEARRAVDAALDDPTLDDGAQR